MRILVLTRKDIGNKREWSGLFFYMKKALVKRDGEVVFAGAYHPAVAHFFLRALRRLVRFLSGRTYLVSYSWILALMYRWHYSGLIRAYAPDVILAIAASPECSLIKTNIPIIYIGDATIRGLQDGYAAYSDLIGFSRWESGIIEKRTLQRSRMNVFSSTWAADSAIRDYSVPCERVSVVSFGANLDRVPTMEEIERRMANKTVHILFLGVDWFRKGGDVVWRAFKEMRLRGYDVKLTICGCTPPDSEGVDCRVVPFLDKNRESDFEVLYSIFLNTHFLFLPSRSDCTPIVFCEAAAFGIPVITSDVGGISSVVIHGVTGFTMPVVTTAAEYADLVRDYGFNADSYRKLVVESRLRYEKQLNWDEWGTQMKAIIEAAVHE